MKPEKSEKKPNFIERWLVKLLINKLIKKLNTMKLKAPIIGWLTLVGAVIVGVVNLLDGNPDTTINFEQIVDAFAAVGIAIPVWLISLLVKNDAEQPTDPPAAKPKK